MAGTKRAISPLSKEIGQFVAERRELRGWDRQQLADQLNEYLDETAQVNRMTIRRIELGAQELKVNELEALSLVLGLPLSDLTNPRAASDRELRALEAELVAARDARWTADARLYETARKIGDTYLREGREVRAKAVTDLFERVLRVTPPRSVVPEFVRKDSRQAVYKIARVGLRHPAQLATLKAEAARSEKAIETLTRIRGRNPDDPELIDDLIELTRERLTNTYDQLEAISSYTH